MSNTNETAQSTISFNNLGQMVVKCPPQEQIQRELEQRRARPLPQRMERPEFTPSDFQAMLTELASDLENAVETYQANEGKPNLPLIQARERVAKLTAELEEAHRVLASQQTKGSILGRFRAGVHRVESSLEGLVGRFGEFVMRQIIASRLGYNPPRERVSPELKNEIRQHIRVFGLRKFEPVRSAGVRDNDGAERLIHRANIAFEKLQAFRFHIESDQADNASHQ